LEQERKEEQKKRKRELGFLAGAMINMMDNMLTGPVDVNVFIEKLFQTADLDHNGNVTFEEFKKFCNEEHNNATKIDNPSLFKDIDTQITNQMNDFVIETQPTNETVFVSTQPTNETVIVSTPSETVTVTMDI